MRLRFSIRDLMWLTLVVALTLGWWLKSMQLSTVEEKYNALTVYLPMLEQRIVEQRDEIEEFRCRLREESRYAIIRNWKEPEPASVDTGAGNGRIGSSHH
jgi:hypothetical protein